MTNRPQINRMTESVRKATGSEDTDLVIGERIRRLRSEGLGACQDFWSLTYLGLKKCGWWVPAGLQSLGNVDLIIVGLYHD